MSDERGSFLSRWSSRKLEAKHGQDDHASDSPEPPNTTVPAEPEVTPDEVAALPRIEEITAETDISGFLRKGVPEGLRKAALRRMWLLDPKIRDYVGDARDYAYDWNSPGGVPTSGPLTLADDPARMLARVIGSDGQSPAKLEHSSGAMAPDGAAGQPNEVEGLIRLPDSGPVPVGGHGAQFAASVSQPAADSHPGGAPHDPEQGRPVARRKRHGTAKPA